MSVIQVGVLGIVATMLAIQFQGSHKEYTIVIGLAVGVLIFLNIISKLEVIVEAIDEIQSVMQIDVVYIETILKMLGITYVSELASGICKDAGYGNIAKQVELFSKITILALSMPILLALLETIEMFLV